MYNEEENIRPAINMARRGVRAAAANGEIGDYELVVVDDASTDATASIADELRAAEPRVRVVHHPTNRKLGGALKTGYAVGDRRPRPLHRRRPALRHGRARQGAAHAAHLRGRHRQRLPLRPHGRGLPARACTRYIYNHMVRVIFGVRIRDVNFAFKLLPPAMFDQVELKSEGSFIDAELIIRAPPAGYRIIQFGVDYFPRTRGDSTLASSGRDRQDRQGDVDAASGAASDPPARSRARSVACSVRVGRTVLPKS